jgi:hypothetical protein
LGSGPSTIFKARARLLYQKSIDECMERLLDAAKGKGGENGKTPKTAKGGES